jgi:hypothetical protein
MVQLTMDKFLQEHFVALDFLESFLDSDRRTSYSVTHKVFHSDSLDSLTSPADKVVVALSVEMLMQTE